MIHLNELNIRRDILRRSDLTDSRRKIFQDLYGKVLQSMSLQSFS